MVAAAGTGSFTAAAEELGLTHSAISRRIRAVEVWLGTPLFERHGRGVRLTPAGQRFARTVEQSFDSIVRAAEQWRPHRGVQSVRISVVPSFARLWLLPRLAALQGDPPDLFLDVGTEHQLADLREGGVDLAIRYGAGSWPELQATLLFREELFPVAAPALAARLGANADARAILGHPLIHDSDASQWRSWFAAAGVTYRPRTMDRRFEDYDLVLETAAAGVAVALLRLPLAGEWLRSGRLRRVARPSIANPAAHFAVVRRGEVRPPVQRLLTRLRDLSAAPDPRGRRPPARGSS
jgi:LysR family transcriptional regulator, glycine cleavage system transcriptional activator